MKGAEQHVKGQRLPPVLPEKELRVTQLDGAAHQEGQKPPDANAGEYRHEDRPQKRGQLACTV